MDYLQYLEHFGVLMISMGFHFKPYYKWITFNIKAMAEFNVNYNYKF